MFSTPGVASPEEPGLINSVYVLFSVLEAGKPDIKTPADLMSARTPVLVSSHSRVKLSP